MTASLCALLLHCYYVLGGEQHSRCHIAQCQDTVISNDDKTSIRACSLLVLQGLSGGRLCTFNLHLLACQLLCNSWSVVQQVHRVNCGLSA